MLINCSFRLSSISSSEELVRRYGEVADTDSGGVVDGVGDGGRADDADLTIVCDTASATRITDLRPQRSGPGGSIELTG